MKPIINQQLITLTTDLARKSPRTRTYYRSIAKKFLTESGDFSRAGMIKFLNSIKNDNSARVSYYVLKRLCKALGKKFPLDKDDLPVLPDEETMQTPTTSLDNTKRLIAYWKNYPGDYVTSLLFLSTVYGLRSIEMTTIKIEGNNIIVSVAKRRGEVIRKHPVPEEMMKYLSGYDHLSEMSVRYAFWKACRRAGVKRQEKENWHSIRRRLNTTCINLGINRILLKRFMRWARDRRDMSDTYYHEDFGKINNEMFRAHPFLPLWG